jgi:hypothetical protein
MLFFVITKKFMRRHYVARRLRQLALPGVRIICFFFCFIICFFCFCFFFFFLALARRLYLSEARGNNPPEVACVAALRAVQRPGAVAEADGVVAAQTAGEGFRTGLHLL